MTRTPPVPPSPPVLDAAPPDAAPVGPVGPTEAGVAPRATLSVRKVTFPMALSLVGIAVAIWLTYEPGAFALMGAALRPGFLFLAVAALVAQVALAAFRIRYVARGRVPYRKAVRAELTWEFVTGITPTVVGGGPVTALFIARENKLSVGEATALTMYMIVADQAWFVILVPSLLIAATWLPVFPDTFGAVGTSTMTLYLLALMSWAAFFSYATLVRPEVFERVARAVLRLRPFRRFEPRVAGELVRLRRQSRVLRGRSPLFFIGAVGLSAGVWLCRYSVLLFIAWSVMPGLQAGAFLLRSAALWLAALILPTPGGAGGMEGLYVLFLEPLLPDGFAGPTLLVWRLLAYYAVVAVGFGIAGSTLHDMFLGRRRKETAVERGGRG